MNFDFIGKKNLKNSGFAFTAMIIIYVLLSFLGQGLISTFAEQGSVIYYLISSLFSIISILVAIFIFAPERKNGVLKSIGVAKFNAIYIIPAITLSIGMFFGLGFVNDGIATALKNANLNMPTINVPLNNVWQLLLFTLSLAVLPAVVEESFFRGVILSGFENTGKIFTAVMIAILFSAYHCSLTQLVYQFIYGFFLTLLTIKAKSVIPAIIAHFLNNFAVLLLTYLNVAINFYAVYFIVVGLALIGTTLAFLLLYDKKTPNTEQKTKSDLVGLLLTSSFGVVICIAMMISGLFI